MAEHNPVANGLLNIHKLITRALWQVIKKCDEYIENNAIPVNEKAGFTMYMTTFIRVMHAHHTGEDEVVFPVVKDRIDAPYSLLLDDHAKISRMLDQLENELHKDSISGLFQLRTILGEIDRMWAPHIRSEEENFTARKLDSSFNKQEQNSLAERIATHSQKAAGPAPITLPFVIYNLEKADRKEFTRDLPWILKSFLIPVVWKKRWKPMKPFLLN